MAAASQFMADLDAALAKIEGKQDAFVREVCFDLFGEMVRATPVLTGFLRASWYASVNTIASRPSSNPAPDPSGGVAIADVSFKLRTASAGDKIYLLNGAKYAARIEYGFVGTDSLGRNYNQAPRSFVRATISSKLDSIVADVARRVAAQS